MAEQILKELTLQLEGMSCAGCAQTIEKSLNKAEGVKNARVNFASEKAYIDYDPSIIDEEQLREVVQESGYDVKDEQESIIIKIGGMTCAGCAAAVERGLQKADGIYEANVNIAIEKGRVEFDPSLLSRGDIKKIVESSGYQLEGFDGDDDTDTDEGEK